MRFPQDDRSMDPFWVHLPVLVCDRLGEVVTRIERNAPEIYENYCLPLRGARHSFDELEVLFASKLDDSTRMIWSLDVEIESAEARQSHPLRIEMRRRVPLSAIAHPHPRPSCFVRVALTLASESLVSRWHADYDHGFETALSDLRSALGDTRTLRACIACKWSDYEPSTSVGHLGCFRAVKAHYAAFASAPDPWTRKYKKESLFADRVWVDELNVCDDFTRRPPSFGYRS